MVRDHLQSPGSPGTSATARAFTLIELMIVFAIMAVVLAVAIPSFVTIRRDLELSKARSDVFAALTAARSRAIRDRTLVALHVFRDTAPAYWDDPATTPPGNPRRWGRVWNGSSWTGQPHVPTNKVTLRLEVAYRGTGAGEVEFAWPADHEPVVLPETLAICRPGTPLDQYVSLTDEYVPAHNPPIRVPFNEDFYIVFAEDGKVATFLIDYNTYYDTAAPVTNPVNCQLVDSAGALIKPDGTWSATGLCLYDTGIFKARAATGNQYAYVNGPDCLVPISSYTGLPLEASK